MKSLRKRGGGVGANYGTEKFRKMEKNIRNQTFKYNKTFHT